MPPHHFPKCVSWEQRFFPWLAANVRISTFVPGRSTHALLICQAFGISQPTFALMAQTPAHVLPSYQSARNQHGHGHGPVKERRDPCLWTCLCLRGRMRSDEVSMWRSSSSRPAVCRPGAVRDWQIFERPLGRRHQHQLCLRQELRLSTKGISFRILKMPDSVWVM